MEAKEVLDLVKNLAESQGSYSRLHLQLMSVTELERDAWLKTFSDCESQTEVVARIEGWG